MTDLLHQQVYDTVASHLLAQRKPARITLKSIVQCAYRTDQGLKCAIGCLIPDDKYDPKMEGKDIRYLQRVHPDLLPKVDSKFLTELQMAHDNTFYPYGLKAWAGRMLSIATTWKLNPAIIRTHLENPNDTP